jgi:hypothetical protein
MAPGSFQRPDRLSSLGGSLRCICDIRKIDVQTSLFLRRWEEAKDYIEEPPPEQDAFGSATGSTQHRGRDLDHARRSGAQPCAFPG